METVHSRATGWKDLIPGCLKEARLQASPEYLHPSLRLSECSVSPTQSLPMYLSADGRLTQVNSNFSKFTLAAVEKMDC